MPSVSLQSICKLGFPCKYVDCWTLLLVRFGLLQERLLVLLLLLFLSTPSPIPDCPEFKTHIQESPLLLLCLSDLRMDDKDKMPDVDFVPGTVNTRNINDGSVKRAREDGSM